MTIVRPQPTDYHPAFARYVARVPEESDIIGVIERQGAATQELLARIDETRSQFRYAEGKWSIKTMLVHLSDAERVFAYRLLAIARGEEQNLPGFDEESYAANSGADAVPFAELTAQYALLRAATVSLLRTLPPDAWGRRGTANGATIGVTALAWIFPGHERHHLNVLHEKYGVT